MPKYYCDYCDIFLTHDSPSVRKSHNDGWKHKAAVRAYYSQFEEDSTQDLIDQKIREFETKAQYPGMAPPPFAPPFAPPFIGAGAPGAPFFRPPMPGMMPPGMMPPPVIPPVVSAVPPTVPTGTTDSAGYPPAADPNSWAYKRPREDGADGDDSKRLKSEY